MLDLDAGKFLANYGQMFATDTITAMVWTADDDDFGRSLTWDIRPVDPKQEKLVEAMASFDLQSTQLMLSVSERPLVADSLYEAQMQDVQVVFDALIQFEDRTVVLNGDVLEYCDAAIREVIRVFNEVID